MRAHHVGRDRAAGQEPVVRQAFHHQHVDQRQDDGGVRAGHDADPLGGRLVPRVVAPRRQAHHRRGPGGGAGEVGAEVPAGHHLGVGAAQSRAAQQCETMGHQHLDVPVPLSRLALLPSGESPSPHP
ncbi:hypothetical protein CNX65_21635 [Actinosynnema pretiosum]|uniref:Uncharacterized protein n=1 Tax=Actinosynnema pretiosum TaxID=42197 RepID=A0A290Z9B7_9PSEU|nr:hypothetical protein CNX65_21635 [Actinosynnema pretiosum]